MSDGSRQTLTSALEGEVGQVLGGDRGRALLQTICAMRGDVHGHRQAPRVLPEEPEAIEALERDVAKLQTALQAYEEKINQLERVRSRATDA